MRVLLIIIMILLLSGCGKKNYPRTYDVECKKYFRLIKKNWKQRKDGIFYFKTLENYEEIFKTNYFYHKICVNYLNEKDVEFLFGEPTEVIENDNGWVYVYAMGTLDYGMKKHDAQLSINFEDRTKKVKDIYFGPSAIEGVKMKRKKKEKRK